MLPMAKCAVSGSLLRPTGTAINFGTGLPIIAVLSWLRYTVFKVIPTGIATRRLIWRATVATSISRIGEAVV